jgi:predicted Zn-dependent peptidase
MIDYQVYTLPNGIRILFKHSASTITHCCFVVNAGARDELAQGKDGLAHFIEHLLFKETESAAAPPDIKPPGTGRRRPERLYH